MLHLHTPITYRVFVFVSLRKSIVLIVVYIILCVLVFVGYNLLLFIFYLLHAALDIYKDTENIKLVFCAVKDTIMQSALKEFNLA